MTFKPTSALALALAAAAPGSLLAGEPAAVIESAPAASNGDWCEWLSNKPGVLYKNKENPFIQEFQIEGRLQYQFGYIDGDDVTGGDFNETFDEWRRARLGAKVKFLNYFGLKSSFNLVADGRNNGSDLDWGHQDFDEFILSADLAKAFGGGPFDELSLNYGRHKFVLGHEARTSSTKLLTVERSALSNKVYGSYRPTGFSLDAAKGPWSFTGAVYSTGIDGTDHEFLSGWGDGLAYYLSAGYEVNDQLNLRADFVYNDSNATDGEDSLFDYEWAASFNAQYDVGPWGIIGDVIIGDNGGADNGVTNPDREGTFWGVVVMPYAWIVEDRLQGVLQYQFASASESEGLRVNSRYARASTVSTNVNSGRGDTHHSLYAGLNYYLCDHNAKIQAGVEWQTMDTPAGDFDALTYIVGFRTYF